MKPIVAIVGRPNVGKSMLFNRLAGQRLSIVEDTPGVTRDRLYADCEWGGRTFTIVDTGGIEPNTDSEILQFMRDQAELAIQNANVIVLVCDIRTGVTAADQDVANMLLRSYNEGRGPFVNRKSSLKLAQEVVDQLGVVTPDVFTSVRKLSGGNVQKVLVGREIAAAPSVLMTAYAVRGLDINTSYAIYDLINQQKEKGCAVIFVGEDLDVLLELCDRILVLCSGQVNGILDGPGATKEQVGLLMTNLQEKGGADNG